jgi:hypothetical protein
MAKYKLCFSDGNPFPVIKSSANTCSDCAIRYHGVGRKEGRKGEPQLPEGTEKHPKHMHIGRLLGYLGK